MPWSSLPAYLYDGPYDAWLAQPGRPPAVWDASRVVRVSHETAFRLRRDMEVEARGRSVVLLPPPWQCAPLAACFSEDLPSTLRVDRHLAPLEPEAERRVLPVRWCSSMDDVEVELHRLVTLIQTRRLIRDVQDFVAVYTAMLLNGLSRAKTRSVLASAVCHSAGLATLLAADLGDAASPGRSVQQPTSMSVADELLLPFDGGAVDGEDAQDTGWPRALDAILRSLQRIPASGHIVIEADLTRARITPSGGEFVIHTMAVPRPVAGRTVRVTM